MKKMKLDLDGLQVESFTSGKSVFVPNEPSFCSTDRSLSGCPESSWCDPNSYKC
ncbi:MAG TPA: hypothetical protein VF625_11680 [Longimicrobium sp.]|jgi:hypothetical protein